MWVTLVGVRGSTPAPGPDFVRVGGHTSCVAVTPEGSAVPRLVLDAGTGIRAVTALLDGGPFVGTIALTHLHWDHVQGLPFFAAGDRDDARVRLLLPTGPHDGGPDGGVDPVALLSRALSPPHFPIGPTELRGDWTFEAIGPGTVELEGLTVSAVGVAHKGGPTLGYRVADAAGSMAYVPDHRPRPGTADWEAVVELAAGVDLFVHDAQFTAAEVAVADLYAHATVDQALALAEAAGVGELVLFHHAPGRTDDQVAAVAAAVADTAAASGATLRVTAAVEGATWHLR